MESACGCRSWKTENNSGAASLPSRCPAREPKSEFQVIGVGDQPAELLRLRRQLPIQVHGRQFLPYQSQIVNLDRAGCDRNGQLCAVWIEGKPTDAKMVGHL